MGQYRCAELKRNTMSANLKTLEHALTRQPEQPMKQLLKATAVISAVCGVLAGISTVAAHHSATMFDHAKSVTITGTAVELRWVNPHVSLSVNGTIKEGDEPALWVLEMTSPGNLVRAGGWTRNAVKPGDRVEVIMSPLRDSDKKGGALKKLTLLDTGQVFTANLREQEKPGLE
jgi:Family of unknown function (DUF6152)